MTSELYILYENGHAIIEVNEDQTVDQVVSICKEMSELKIRPEIGNLTLFNGTKELPLNSLIKNYLGKVKKFELKENLDIECFSNPGIDSHKVCEDFGIYYVETDDLCEWRLEKEQLTQPPTDLVKFVKLYFKFTTNGLEKSRRFIVSSFLLSVLDFVGNDGPNCMVIEEEKRLKFVINGKSYNGDVDFVIGHSKQNKKVANDSCILVLEAKQGNTFDNSFGQVLAQAATTHKIRKSNERGNKKDGLPIYFIRTDGDGWIFGILTEIDQKLLLKQSTKLTIGSYKDEDFLKNMQKIFSWLVVIFQEMKVSSPRLNKKF